MSGVGMGMGFAPTWLRQVSPPSSLLHKTTLTTGIIVIDLMADRLKLQVNK